MKVGAIGYDTAQGLGYLLKDYYDHGVVDEVLIIPHRHYQRRPDFYAGKRTYSQAEANEFVKAIDVLLLFENAFNWDIVRAARTAGKRIVLMPMYEWTPNPCPVAPDLMLCPSMLDVDVYKDRYRCSYIPVPVSSTWRRRDVARVWVHNAGHGGHGYRNGTPEIIEAWRHVRTPARLIVRGQPEEKRMADILGTGTDDPRITIVPRNLSSREELWSEGDVMIAMEKYNGLSLPLQEAWASGMMVMTTDRYPANTWLPREPLVEPAGTKKRQMTIEINECIIDPKMIANKVDDWYGRDIGRYSDAGRQYGETHSWDVLRPWILAALRG